MSDGETMTYVYAGPGGARADVSVQEARYWLPPAELSFTDTRDGSRVTFLHAGPMRIAGATDGLREPQQPGLFDQEIEAEVIDVEPIGEITSG